ncbi:PVC-type heme-binding CxxCH protein [Tundrisphaera lichenicola]|uniref:PVC-type heme-binding CxxCH protein n=1 Tax=Tundrisphaera lichenicola TaxID=2029860 RepID=UPI003EBFB7E7
MLAIGLLAPASPGRADDPAPKPLKVLFLGDQGHHRPADRAAQIIPLLATRGIDVTYTEATSDLNPETLAKYDVLMIYANIEKIEPDQEKALLDYVENGGGFAPIHCASFCFLNSPKYVALVGAQFKSHGTGEFDTKVVDLDHPIMKGLANFRTWDETYVHAKHNEEGRHLLQVRDENGRDEPWTWVRTQGKGRVFYTAYGHDQRTFGNPGFHDLIERGIRWAAHKGEVFDSRPKVAANLKPLPTEPAPADIPQYLPGKAWGTMGDGIKTMQLPVEPSESIKHLALPNGLEPRLFAAEPEIAKPIAIAWDHKGRLWVAETVDYPNNMQRRGAGHDQIKICEDTDGDGRADKFTVFADKLSIPTSIVFANGGLVLHQAPDTLFLQDTDGDDKADVRKTLFTGWGTNDTHAGPSNLRYGLDNWIYGIVGYSGFQGTIGGEQHDFRQGIYRFKPDGSKLEFLRNTNNNSWGVGISEEGLIFGSTANGCPSVYLPIASRYYEKVRGQSTAVLANIADTNRMFPITEKVRQVDFFGGFTAGAGHALYTARLYPRPYWNSTAFVAEPTGHLVATFALEKKGSDFASHNEWNLLASDDEWTSPVAAEVGPDGAVWVSDWYNFIVQHNPTPRGFKTGRGNAYETPLRDKTHGRIYRVSPVGSPSKTTTLTLDPADPKGLVEALKNDNLFWRLHAQRLIVERGQKDLVPALVALTKDTKLDGIGLTPGAIHALWALKGLGVLDGSDPAASSAVVAALGHPSSGVRRNALQVLPADAKAPGAIQAAKLVSDPDPLVRLAALLALADAPESPEAADSIVEALATGQVDGDRWLPDAATSAAAQHAGPFLKALAARKFDQPASRTILTIAGRVAEHYSRGATSGTSPDVLTALKGADKGVADTVIAGLAAGWPKDKKPTLDDSTDQALVDLLGRVSTGARAQLVSLASRWGSKAIEAHTAEIAANFLAIASDEAQPEAARVDAAQRLIEFRPGDLKMAEALLALITPKTPQGLAGGLVEAAGRSDSTEVGRAIVEQLGAMTPTVRVEASRALLSRPEWTAAFLDGVEKGDVSLAQLSLAQTQSLASHKDKAIADRAKMLIARGGGLPDANRQKVIDELSPLVLKGGDAAKGKLVFAQQCAKCHMYGGEGGKVGPDLTGMGTHPREELLIHIIDPSRSVEGNFVQYNLATTGGQVINGLLASESKTAVELIDAEGKPHQVLREEIEEFAASKKSLMPEGFEKTVGPEGVADLLAFLTKRGKYLPIDLRSAATVVTTKGMFFDPESPIERLVFRDWSPKVFEGIPFLLVDPQGDRVPNAIMLYGPNGSTPPKMPRSVTLPCNAPAKAIHFLSGISGWGATGSDADQTTSMIVRLHYADGETEDHRLRNGIHFADYIRPVDVPGSKLAFRLRGQQLRYLAVNPQRKEPIAKIELLKGPDDTAPIVMAVTIEGEE